MMPDEENIRRKAEGDTSEASETLGMVQMAKTVATLYKTLKQEGLTAEEASILTMNMLSAGFKSTQGPDALEDI